MKKALSIILVLAMMLSTFALLPVSAEEAAVVAPKLNELSDLGQVKVGVVDKDVAAPVADGVVNDGEYETVYTFDKTNPNYAVNAGTDKFGYIKMAISEDADNIYVAFVVQVDEYVGTRPNKDELLVQMSFGQGSDTAAMKQYFQTSLWYEIQKSGNFVLNTSLQGGASVWGWMNKLHGDAAGNNALVNATGAKDATDATTWQTVAKANHRFYSRSVDADQKAITVYEYKYIKSVIKEAYGIDEIDQAYFRVVAKSDDGNNGLASEVYFPNTIAKMTGEQKEKADKVVADLKSAYGSAPSCGWFGHVIKFYDVPNTYEVPEIGQQTIEVNGKATTAPKADGVVGANEYTYFTTFTLESAGIGQKFNAGFDKNEIGYVQLGISYDDDAIYFAIVVQEDNFKYGKGNNSFSLQVLADDDGDSASALKQLETTMYINGTEAAPTFFAGTGNYNVNEQTGATGSAAWTYLNTMHGEKNDPTPATAKYRYYTRGTDADGKAITTYEIQYKMSEMKKYFGEDNDFSRIAIKLNAWSYNAEGKQTGRWTYWNAPDADLSAALKAAYGYAPSTIGNVVVLKDVPATPDTSDNSVKYVVLGTFALVAVVALGTTVVYKKRRQLSK